MTYSEPESQIPYSSFLVTIRLSRLVSEMFVRDRQTDGRALVGRTTQLHPYCGGPANEVHATQQARRIQ